jgi:5-methylcytosine-specific restriction protein A
MLKYNIIGDNTGEFNRGDIMSKHIYEQDETARKVCIEYHGNSCSVCGFRYDNIFNEEYLEVHYIEPLQTTDTNRTLDPVHDLRPICAYCHEVIHSYEPILTIEELKALMSNKAS